MRRRHSEENDSEHRQIKKSRSTKEEESPPELLSLLDAFLPVVLAQIVQEYSRRWWSILAEVHPFCWVRVEDGQEYKSDSEDDSEEGFAIKAIQVHFQEGSQVIEFHEVEKFDLFECDLYRYDLSQECIFLESKRLKTYFKAWTCTDSGPPIDETWFCYDIFVFEDGSNEIACQMDKTFSCSHEDHEFSGSCKFARVERMSFSEWKEKATQNNSRRQIVGFCPEGLVCVQAVRRPECQEDDERDDAFEWKQGGKICITVEEERKHDEEEEEEKEEEKEKRQKEMQEMIRAFCDPLEMEKFEEEEKKKQQSISLNGIFFSQSHDMLASHLAPFLTTPDLFRCRDACRSLRKWCDFLAQKRHLLSRRIQLNLLELYGPNRMKSILQLWEDPLIARSLYLTGSVLLWCLDPSPDWKPRDMDFLLFKPRLDPLPVFQGWTYGPPEDTPETEALYRQLRSSKVSVPGPDHWKRVGLFNSATRDEKHHIDLIVRDGTAESDSWHHLKAFDLSFVCNAWRPDGFCRVHFPASVAARTARHDRLRPWQEALQRVPPERQTPRLGSVISEHRKWIQDRIEYWKERIQKYTDRGYTIQSV